MIPNSIWKFAQRIDNFYGGNAYLVGGWVRDHVLGVENKDYDIEVHGVPIEELKDFIGRYYDSDVVGESYKVWKVYLYDDERKKLTVDVSVPRTEKKVGVGHKAFEVTGDPFLSIEEACRRRDFTMNAMLYHVLDNKIIDPYGGQEDIKNKVIRVVDPETFVEDSLRVLRAMQFAARFDFGIANETVELCRQIDLSDLPSERVWGELEKWLLSKYPVYGLYAGRSLKIFEKLFPMMDLSADKVLDVVGNAMAFVNSSNNTSKTEKLAVNLCIVSIFFSSVADLEKFFDKIKLYTIDGYNLRRKVLQIKEHCSIDLLADGTLTSIRRASTKYDIGLVCDAVSAVLGANGFSIIDIMSVYRKAKELGCLHDPVSPILMGKHVLDLGVQPGKKVGEICDAVFQLQIEGKIGTLEEALREAKKLL